MDDLIRRSDVIKVLKECYLDELLFEKDVFDGIKAIPTAYNVNAVVAELEKASKTMMPVIPTNHAIYIVKNGSNPELFKYYGVGIGETAVIKKFGINIEERGGVE